MSSDFLPKSTLEVPGGADGVVVLKGVLTPAELKALLERNGQQEWTGKKRVSGLLLIIDRFSKYGRQKMSTELSRDLVSRLSKSKNMRTIRDPLMLLCRLGVIKRTKKAVVTHYKKESAEYMIHPKWGRVKDVEVSLSKQQYAKLKTAPERVNRKLNKTHRTRTLLLETLPRIGLSNEGNKIALGMIIDQEKEDAVKSLVRSIGGKGSQGVRYDSYGAIHSFPRQAPQELKPHLTANDRPTVIVDLEAAHLCTIPCVLADQIDLYRSQGRSIEALEDECRSFIALIGSADIYEHLSEGGDRGRTKKEILTALNMENCKARKLPAYQQFKRAFPQCVRVIEDLKAGESRHLSWMMNKHLARIIEPALWECQQEGILAIPDTDALIVPATDEVDARAILHKWLFKVTGIHR